MLKNLSDHCNQQYIRNPKGFHLGVVKLLQKLEEMMYAFGFEVHN